VLAVLSRNHYVTTMVCVLTANDDPLHVGREQIFLGRKRFDSELLAHLVGALLVFVRDSNEVHVGKLFEARGIAVGVHMSKAHHTNLHGFHVRLLSIQPIPNIILYSIHDLPEC